MIQIILIIICGLSGLAFISSEAFKFVELMKKKKQKQIYFEHDFDYKGHKMIIWVKESNPGAIDLLFDIGWKVNNYFGRYFTGNGVEDIINKVEQARKEAEVHIDKLVALPGKIEKAKQILKGYEQKNT